MTVRNKKLNARLSAIAGFVDDGESVADIGADHGYLPVHLVREGISPFAILTDLNPGPLEKTRAMIQKSCMDNQKSFIDNRKLELRLGDGLTALGDGEVDTVVIAGMGGETIISILAKDPAKAMSFRKYVLQPRTKTEILKEWVSGAGWTLLAEAQAEERGRLCEILVCAPKGNKGERNDRQS